MSHSYVQDMCSSAPLQVLEKAMYFYGFPIENAYMLKYLAIAVLFDPLKIFQNRFILWPIKAMQIPRKCVSRDPILENHTFGHIDQFSCL